MKKAGKILLITLAALTVVGTGAAIAKHYHDAGAFKYPGEDEVAIAFNLVDWKNKEYDRNYTIADKDDTQKTVTLDYSDDTETLCKVPGTVTVGSTQYTVAAIKGFVDNHYTKAVYLPDGFSGPMQKDVETDADLFVPISTNKIEYISIGDGVTALPKGFAAGFESLSKVDFRGDEITAINIGSFIYCKSLKSIDLPKSVINVNSAFMHSGLESITLPNGVLSINGFEGCSNLKKVAIGENATTIASGAFKNCRSLETINLPDSLTQINNDSFYNDNTLKNITIPASVSTICGGSFYGAGGYVRVRADAPVVNEKVFKKDTPVFFDAYKAKVTWATLATERTDYDKKIYYKGMWKLVNGVPTVLENGEAAVAPTASSSALN